MGSENVVTQNLLLYEFPYFHIAIWGPYPISWAERTLKEAEATAPQTGGTDLRMAQVISVISL